MDAEPDSGFMIDGRLYDVPDFGTFTMSEAQILYDYCGIALEDLASREDETDAERLERRARFRNPGFMAALMHIAYQRGNPALTKARVEALIGKTSLVAAMETLQAEEDDASPPGPGATSELAPLSRNGSDDLSVSSGSDSDNASEVPDAIPAPTGTTKSPTSPTSDPTT